MSSCDWSDWRIHCCHWSDGRSRWLVGGAGSHLPVADSQPLGQLAVGIPAAHDPPPLIHTLVVKERDNFGLKISNKKSHQILNVDVGGYARKIDK